MVIGQKIKQLRKQKGISIEELATKLGKNKATVYRYEKGDISNLPLDILEPLARALDTTPQHLMGWDIPEVYGMRITEGDDESAYVCTNVINVNHVERWHREFGIDPFSEEEHEKLIEYAKFLITLREK